MEKLHLIPIGGCGEVGKNMLAIEYGRNILLIDAGLMFPESDMLGIDYIIPDYRFLLDKADRVRGIVITHGHEDHIGALPHVLREFSVPVYATQLTRGLIEVKLREAHMLKETTLHTIIPGEVLRIGPFIVEPYHVCHSIPDAVGLGITTPVGLIVHSGDFKLDHTPVDGRPTDFAKLAEFSGRGVLALLSDSTNADQPGTTPSERTLTPALNAIFAQAQGRIIIATFASLISRVQQIFDVAQKHGRRVALGGTTMIDNIKMARKLGYIHYHDTALITLEQANSLPPAEVCIVITGAQGEPNSILGRLAYGRHATLKIVPGDTVILSSHTIPGNEEMVHRVINRLFQKGATVIYHPNAPIHVSGHASQEEQKMLLNIVRPRFFIPVHGELRHLKHHAHLAQEVGIPPERIAVVENGYRITLTPDSMTIGERVPGGYVFVDGSWIGDVIGPSVIRDRDLLATAGMCVVLVRYRALARTVKETRIEMRGVTSAEAAARLSEEATHIIERVVHESTPMSPAHLELVLRRALEDFFYQQTKNRPLTLVMAVQED